MKLVTTREILEANASECQALIAESQRPENVHKREEIMILALRHVVCAWVLASANEQEVINLAKRFAPEEMILVAQQRAMNFKG